MRRRFIRSLQMMSMRWMAPERRARAYRGLVRQNVLARRIGLPVIQFLVFAVLISLAFQIVYSSAVYLVESGILRPQRLEPIR